MGVREGDGGGNATEAERHKREGEEWVLFPSGSEDKRAPGPVTPRGIVATVEKGPYVGEIMLLPALLR